MPGRHQVAFARALDRSVGRLALNLTQQDSLPGLPDLQEMHALGFLTTESQPGVFESGEWGDSEQRGYLCGFIPRRFLWDMVEQLRRSGCVTLVHDLGVAPEAQLPAGVNSMDGIQDIVGNWLNPNNPSQISLTRQRNPGERAWEYYTNTPILLSGLFEEALEQNIEPKDREAVGIYCALVQVIRIPMGVPDIMEIVRDALRRASRVRSERRAAMAKFVATIPAYRTGAVDSDRLDETDRAIWPLVHDLGQSVVYDDGGGVSVRMSINDAAACRVRLEIQWPDQAGPRPTHSPAAVLGSMLRLMATKGWVSTGDCVVTDDDGTDDDRSYTLEDILGFDRVGTSTTLKAVIYTLIDM